MDEERSATTHDPAARLGRATDVPDGMEHLGAEAGPGTPPATARPAAAGWPSRWGGEEPGAPHAAGAPDGGAASDRADRRVPPGAVATTDGDTTADGDAGRPEGATDEEDDDPPPRWAARPELRITPRAAAGPAEVDEPPAARAPSRRATYWAVAVLVVFGVIAAVGLIGSGGGGDQAATGDGGPGTTTRSESSASGAAATGPAGGDDGGTAPGDQGEGAAAGQASTTTGSTAPAITGRPPDVGECALIDAGTPPAYVQVPCDDPRAALTLTQKVTAPPAPGARCPDGTDSVTQVSDQPGTGAAAVTEFWCLRNVHPPHPGDPGGGSGELVVGDCLGVAPSSQSIEVPCDGSGLVPEFSVAALPDAAGNCPADADASINLEVPFPARFCLRYV